MSTKITHYATRFSRRIPVHPVDAAAPDTLTKEEDSLLKTLSQNTHGSLVGCIIREVTREVGRDGGVPRFRKLITELRSQAKDCPEGLKLIIGESAYGQLFFFDE